MLSRIGCVLRGFRGSWAPPTHRIHPPPLLAAGRSSCCTWGSGAAKEQIFRYIRASADALPGGVKCPPRAHLCPRRRFLPLDGSQKRCTIEKKVHGHCLLAGTRGTRAAAAPVCFASRRTIELKNVRWDIGPAVINNSRFELLDQRLGKAYQRTDAWPGQFQRSTPRDVEAGPMCMCLSASQPGFAERFPVPLHAASTRPAPPS